MPPPCSLAQMIIMVSKKLALLRLFNPNLSDFRQIEVGDWNGVFGQIGR